MPTSRNGAIRNRATCAAISRRRTRNRRCGSWKCCFRPAPRVTYETAAREALVYQQVWILEGKMDIAVGAAQYSLEAGDCLAFQLDSPVAYHNPHRKPARYAVASSTDNAHQ